MSSVFAVYRSRLLGTVWTAWLPGVKASYQDGILKLTNESGRSVTTVDIPETDKPYDQVVILLDSGFLTIDRTNLIKAYDKGLSALPRYMSYIPCD